jgi:putative copper export protein
VAPVSCARFPGVRIPARSATALAAICAALVSLLLAAPLALADNGVGLAGPTTDKTVTFFCFGVIAFFAILVTVMSIIQGRLEARKERRRADLERYS